MLRELRVYIVCIRSYSRERRASLCNHSPQLARRGAYFMCTKYRNEAAPAKRLPVNFCVSAHVTLITQCDLAREYIYILYTCHFIPPLHMLHATVINVFFFFNFFLHFLREGKKLFFIIYIFLRF